ncbi:general secretion pathway protein GspD [Pseudidiomarina sp. 1ASP75-14]|uniref:secretin N-terminal domain-containing protein n=1 Tax=Pseudidiomarina terrestris TaxID=2820060 RepID=UPI002650BA3E|nr:MULTISPECIES: secretin N-terminal domain-containing protein [unclassified Pseudidiomarina]MDN7126975.1 general secretion pathway protein GspD [Pseudidiomarina sp. 1APR75-33.1]MDN7136816.1 general secretion pathway protein GspD [Pseudidiomarina sp. 1ASP75-14]
MSRTHLKYCVALLAACSVLSCAQTPEPIKVNPKRLEANDINYSDNETRDEPTLETKGFQQLRSMDYENYLKRSDTDPAKEFSTTDSHSLNANELPLRNFIETVFGTALQANYVIATQGDLKQNVTLNLSNSVSSRELFSLSRQLLIDNGLDVSLRDGTYYIYPRTDARTDIVIGFGRRYADVPDTAQKIMQVIPLKYGLKTSLERTLRNLSSVKVSADQVQNAFFVEGNRAEIIRFLDLVHLLDVPANRGRHVAMVELTYLSPMDYIDQIKELMEAEGVSVGRQAGMGVAVLTVPVAQLGAVAMFASNEEVLDRARYWTQQIDQPSKGPERGYYIYHPRYARASDLGASIGNLMGSTQMGGNTARDTQSAQGGATGQSGQRGMTASNEDMRMTVDERSNSIIFYTTGGDYKALLPVVRRLDVMPKQIVLDATIAEVTLTDEFAQGFEFAFRNGNFSGGTLGTLGAQDIGGLRLSWVDGFDRFIANLQQSSNLVNVISNPTLVVRDGVAASINVGNDIPTVGSTTFTPNLESQTQSVEYRKTGVQLTVTPTINAQGLVVLQINQTISNTSPTGPSVAGNPSIFERAIQTEVIAQSGQTILLGGLISENNSSGDSKVPLLGDIPLLGNLFKSEKESNEKTELVIFITPRIIERTEQWEEIRKTIADGLTTISVND